MRIKALYLENFRSYRDRTKVNFENITALVGTNDAGKSTVLEALDIFFNDNKAITKASKDDINIHSTLEGNEEFVIGVIFDDVPDELIIDSNVATSLEDEYLLNHDGYLEIKKVFKNGKLKNTFIVANYPKTKDYGNIHSLKLKELQNITQNLDLDVSDKRVSSLHRIAILKKIQQADFELTDISIGDEGTKNIWNELVKYLPIYELFQSDRKNADSDKEIQDPMKLLINEALKKDELIKQLDEVHNHIRKEAVKLANKTLEKLSEMNGEIAKELTPNFADPAWGKAFSFSLDSDDGISLNKRGSGVRRLVLLNFFRAEAERRQYEKNSPNIIYAFEEPETSQHPNHQKLLIESFLKLSMNTKNQVILTTHSPGIAKMLPTSSLKLIDNEDNKANILNEETDAIMQKIASRLGVLPSVNITSISKVKLAICVEGKHDVDFLKKINAVIPDFKEIINLESDSIIIIPMGGSSLQFWVNNDYLKKLNLAQFHIYDSDKGSSDPNKYIKWINEINERENSKAVETKWREMENYVTLNSIKRTNKELGASINEDLLEDWDTLDIPELIAKHTHESSNSTKKWEELDKEKQDKKKGKAKKKINNIIVSSVKKEDLLEHNCYNELESWFLNMRDLIENK